MDYNKLNANSKKSWFIARLITTIIFSGVLIGGKWFLRDYFDLGWITKYSFVINLIIAIILGLLLLNTLLYPIIEYKQWKYAITDDKIDFSEGIFSIKRTVIPIIRVQHIKINQGPINRMFKLADVEIVTAGGSHRIPNIEIQKAEEICEYLKSKIKIKVENDNECRE
ncbi:PH domain-containing protein [Clostridium ihumii]|uniref:PH domain-containing protein n=1 Tax=Clostridium ihumii TaxID=1470356 RepID=UPI00058DEA4B|nr:PH domain-containing protein [Clostridium ihumii]